MKTIEVNFDGLVGLTHHYAGLSDGNLASKSHAGEISNPREAALQGLEKMRLLMNLGVPQGVFPPHERPAIRILKNLGFTGNDAKILQDAYSIAPGIFKSIYSASGMWTANAATVASSQDSGDGKVHFTPANLNAFFHRAIEVKTTTQYLKKIFSDNRHFVIHDPLFAHPDFSDEGAANHNRFCLNNGAKGAHVFVYGKNKNDLHSVLTQKNPARQTLAASEAIARLHQLDPKKILFLKQNALVIDEGIFHNDVISVGNENVFLYHELAFEDPKLVTDFLTGAFPNEFYLIPIGNEQLTVPEAIKSYLFNSQMVTLPDGGMAIIAPLQCQAGRPYDILQHLVAGDYPMKSVHFVACHQSMDNGGGPACLRLRVVLTEAELKACHQAVILDNSLYHRLVTWVKKHYRDRLIIKDLLDPALLDENHKALDELTGILDLGSLYSFQQI